MEVAQLSLEVFVVGGSVDVSTTESCKSEVIPKRTALPRIAFGKLSAPGATQAMKLPGMEAFFTDLVVVHQAISYHIRSVMETEMTIRAFVILTNRHRWHQEPVNLPKDTPVDFWIDFSGLPI